MLSVSNIQSYNYGVHFNGSVMADICEYSHSELQRQEFLADHICNTKLFISQKLQELERLRRVEEQIKSEILHLNSVEGDSWVLQLKLKRLHSLQLKIKGIECSIQDRHKATILLLTEQ